MKTDVSRNDTVRLIILISCINEFSPYLIGTVTSYKHERCDFSRWNIYDPSTQRARGAYEREAPRVLSLNGEREDRAHFR